jgi:hypothetical protein
VDRLLGEQFLAGGGAGEPEHSLPVRVDVGGQLGRDPPADQSRRRGGDLRLGLGWFRLVIESTGEAVENGADAPAYPDSVRAPGLDAQGLLATGPLEAGHAGANLTDAAH